MGNVNSVNTFSTKKKQLLVRTGLQRGKGTDANVSIILFENSGRKTRPISLDYKFRDDFESGHTDNFPVDLRSEEGKPLGDVTEIELWRDDTGLCSDWFCDVIILLDLESGHSVPFPVHRWLKPSFKYRIRAYDTILPQDDPNKTQRNQELEYKRTLYQYSGRDIRLPGMLDKLPDDEEFSIQYFLEMFAKTATPTIFANLLMTISLSSEWKSIDDIKKAFQNNAYDLPKCAEFWNEDEWFAAQRLVGIHPLAIELCTEIPKDFAVNEEDIQPHLEDRALNDVLKDKKLFIVDYRDFDGVQGKENYTVVSPMCLFYLNSKGTLLPVAIQLFAKPGPKNPVFYPSDDINVWTSAKLWFNLADGNFHQAVTHMGLTHMAMDAAGVATHRCFAPNHPVFRLLAPHFFYLFAINQAGLVKLLAEGTAFDQLLNIGRLGTTEMIGKMWGKWRLNVEGTLPKDMENKGILDETVLPNYPYRDDGILVYNAIKDYVTNVLKIYYVDVDKIQNDNELQSWAKLLSTPVDNEGAGFKGIPNDGYFKSLDDIITTCTSLIFTSSAKHAVLNFPAYDAYAFTPNMPLSMTGHPPKNKSPITEREYLRKLPDKSTMLFGMRMSKILSGRGSNSLGDWDIRFQYDRDAVVAENRFREELLQVSLKIKERNKFRSKFFYYECLDPKCIPNSIAI